MLSGGRDVDGGGGGAIDGGESIFFLEFPGKVIEPNEGNVMIGGGGGGCCGDLLRGCCGEDGDGIDGGFIYVCCF